MVDGLGPVEHKATAANGVPMEPTDGNAFLAQLSSADYALFRAHMTGFQLTRGARLHDFGGKVEHVIFPHDGLVAMTMPTRDGGGGGAILMGRDGIVGAFAAAAAVPGPCDAEIYVPGRAARMPAPAFRGVLDQRPALRDLIGRYTAAFMVQAHQTALCNAVHPVEARISRWLLEVRDRCGDDDIPLTQTTLAQMLGVQRTTINLVAGRLAAAGVIKCGRGHVQVIRSDELERHACECYREIKNYLSRLFGPPPAAVSA